MLTYEPTIVIPCKWKPSKGSLYRVLDKRGYQFNDKPVIWNRSSRFQRNGDLRDMVNYGDVFLFLGRVERVPENFSAFHILLRDKLGWLIYPENMKKNDELPIAPLRES